MGQNEGTHDSRMGTRRLFYQSLSWMPRFFPMSSYRVVFYPCDQSRFCSD